MLRKVNIGTIRIYLIVIERFSQTIDIGCQHTAEMNLCEAREERECREEGKKVIEVRRTETTNYLV